MYLCYFVIIYDLIYICTYLFEVLLIESRASYILSTVSET